MNIKQDMKNEAAIRGESIVKSVIEQFINKNYNECMPMILEAQKLFKQEQSYENISICLSLIGLIEYSQNKSKYFKALTYLNDGTYLAESSKNITAKLINEFALATIDFSEFNINTAVLHYQKANHYAQIQDEYGLGQLINERLKELQN
ncbi:MAG: hypothetical protein WCG95_01520, partial [bacterium]